MRVIEISTPGAPDVLTLAEREVPNPGTGEIRIKVEAAGVNRPDILQRQGAYPPPEGASDLPGLEVAGTIDALGPGTVGEVGKRVMALLPGGGYAEYAVCDFRHVIPLPDDLPFAEAAALPETLYTVFTNVFEDGALQFGQTLFVHGATSGIGTMAIKLADVFGAVTFGTAGSDEKCRAAEELGYEACFNYRTDDWVKAMQDEGGADVVLDMVGGDYVAKNLSFLKPRGRHVSIAMLGGATAAVPIFQVMRNRLILTGSTLRARDGAEKARLTDAIRQKCLPKIADGSIRPVIDRTFPLANAADAHRHMEAGDHIGKIVLVP